MIKALTVEGAEDLFYVKVCGFFRMFSQEVQLFGLLARRQCKYKMLKAEKDRLIPIGVESVIDVEMFNTVLNGQYGIVIGKGRKERQRYLQLIQKNSVYSVPDFA